MSTQRTYHIAGSRLTIDFGSVLEIPAEVVVSSDDYLLTMGGGVSAPIRMAAGNALVLDAAKAVLRQAGDVVVTTAGALSSRYVFHVVTIGPNRWEDPSVVPDIANLVRGATRTCLKLMQPLGVGSIVFPALGTGSAGYSIEASAAAMAEVVNDHLSQGNWPLSVSIMLMSRSLASPMQYVAFYEEFARRIPLVAANETAQPPPAPADQPQATVAAIVRMALIPHGATVQARGTSSTIAGKPGIPAVDITPFLTASPRQKMQFPSQAAANDTTARIPQNLAPFIAAGTITQAMLTDPNTLLRNHIASQTITSTTTISISSGPASPLLAGGTNRGASLMSDATASAPGARTPTMEALFWIETVEYTIEVPVFEPGQPPLIIPAPAGAEGQPAPEFLVNPPVSLTAPRYITVRAPQIQYLQQVFLNFIQLTWPHVSVATLVPSSPIPVPPSAWT